MKNKKLFIILLWLSGCVLLSIISVRLKIPFIINLIIGMFWGWFVMYINKSEK